jgi:hypothetical protein
MISHCLLDLRVGPFLQAGGGLNYSSDRFEEWKGKLPGGCCSLLTTPCSASLDSAQRSFAIPSAVYQTSDQPRYALDP